MTFPKTIISAFLALLWASPIQAQDVGLPPNPKGPVPYSTLAAKPRAKPQSSPTKVGLAAAPTQAVVTAKVPGARLAPGELLPPAELEAFVDGLVKDAMVREHIVGATVAIVQDGQVLLKKGYGAASLSPARKVDPDTTLFRLGSISKTFTWITLMREVEAGRIRIDAPINLYLPERLQVRDQGFRAQVLVLNLMDHSAGFEDRALGHLFEKSAARERSLAEYLRQERPRRVHPPGEISSYSNYSAGLAGQAVSYVTGRPFERLVEDEIIVPLALNHTTFREPRAVKRGLAAPMPDRLRNDLSEGFRWTETGYQKRPYEFLGHIAPSSALSSTAGDMSRYMLTLLGDGTLDGVTIFGPKAAAAFRTPIRQTPPGINGWPHGFADYALPGGIRGYGQDGATLSFHSNMVVVPELKLGVFISTNTETGSALAARLPDSLMNQFYAKAPGFPRAGDPRLASISSVFEGHYLGTRRAYGGLEELIGKLSNGIDVHVTEDGRLMTGKDKVWVPYGDPARGEFVAIDGDQRLVFAMNNGRAISMSTAPNSQTFERGGFWDAPLTLAVVAGLTGLAAIATLTGIFLRNRREFRETSIQGRANLIQNIQAVLWICGFVLFAGWFTRTSDIASIAYGWPGPALLTASACVIVASILNLISLLILPSVWRGGRRVDSWTHWRKAGYAATVLIYLGFSGLLFVWGALTPWAT